MAHQERESVQQPNEQQQRQQQQHQIRPAANGSRAHHDEPPVSSSPPPPKVIDLNNVDQMLKAEMRRFVDDIFTDSQSITAERKAHFGQLVRLPEARLLFAIFVDEYRVNSKRVSELTFYSLAQYFSIVLFECLLAEDFRPAKIMMNMMFTYYHESYSEQTPFNGCASFTDKTIQTTITTTTATGRINDSPFTSSNKHSSDQQNDNKIYLYTLLKDQKIFKSLRFWTSAFYESVISERSNHSVFVDREKGKLSNERRDEELDCSKNITFGLLGSFIHNMSLLELSHEFCQDFLDKHSTIAGLSNEQLDMLRTNMRSLFGETHSGEKSSKPRIMRWLPDNIALRRN